MAAGLEAGSRGGGFRSEGPPGWLPSSQDAQRRRRLAVSAVGLCNKQRSGSREMSSNWLPGRRRRGREGEGGDKGPSQKRRGLTLNSAHRHGGLSVCENEALKS